MAILNIRNLPDEVHAQLRIRAARAGQSMEAEARAIITEAVTHEKEGFSVAALQTWVDDLYGSQKPQDVVDSLIQERRLAAAKE